MTQAGPATDNPGNALPLTVVGICSYRPAVHRWLGTLREHFDGPCVLYLTDAEPGVGEKLGKAYKANVIDTKTHPGFWEQRPVGSFCDVWQCILDACMNRVAEGFVLRTDVWDIVFQDDPRRYIQPGLKKILVSYEGTLIQEEEANRIWVGEWAKFFGDCQVINGGMICADRKALALLAGLISKVPLGTTMDQSELELIAGAFPESFAYVPGFMECTYRQFARSGTVIDGRVCDRKSGKPWCVVHGNGPTQKEMFERLFPMERYMEAARQIGF